jgi:hypothetical protein
MGILDGFWWELYKRDRTALNLISSWGGRWSGAESAAGGKSFEGARLKNFHHQTQTPPSSSNPSSSPLGHRRQPYHADEHDRDEASPEFSGRPTPA